MHAPYGWLGGYVAALCGDSFQAPTFSCARRAVLSILFGEPEWWPCVGMWGAAALASWTAVFAAKLR